MALVTNIIRRCNVSRNRLIWCSLNFKQNGLTTIVRQHSTKSKQRQHKFWSRSIKWAPIPLIGGLCFVVYQKLELADKGDVTPLKDWQIRIYTSLPLKILSRLWGQVNSLTLPIWLREPLYGLYSKAFNVKIEEAAIEDLKHYSCLGEFFNRQLKDGVRTVDANHCVVCPSDGKVLHFGRVLNGSIEQVKGLNYSLKGFLGPQNWLDMHEKKTPVPGLSHTNDSDSDFQDSIKINPETNLYHCVIYLAPGDYHGFHSSVDWQVLFRRHFPGELLSVNPGIARLVPGLFNLNERVVYAGKWKYGFFSYIAVGATNVGSIKIFMDKELSTNERGVQQTHIDKDLTLNNGQGIDFRKGDSFGEFNLGSTIVLVFEAPRDFEFKIKEGKKVKYGEPLGHVPRAKAG